MPLVGTVEGSKLFPNESFMEPNADGKPTFKLSELLDHYQLKQYASKPLKSLQKLNEEDEEDDTNN